MCSIIIPCIVSVGRSGWSTAFSAGTLFHWVSLRCSSIPFNAIKTKAITFSRNTATVRLSYSTQFVCLSCATEMRHLGLTFGSSHASIGTLMASQILPYALLALRAAFPRNFMINQYFQCFRLQSGSHWSSKQTLLGMELVKPILPESKVKKKTLFFLLTYRTSVARVEEVEKMEMVQQGYGACWSYKVSERLSDMLESSSDQAKVLFLFS